MGESQYPQIPVDEAVALVLETVAPLAPQSVPLAAAHGLVATRDVAAPEAMPPFAAAAKDGYAVVAADGPGEREVVGTVSAGRPPEVEVSPGTAARIATGAPMPPGADAVVMVEYTHSRNGRVDIDARVSPGADVRPVGTDYRAGAVVLRAGDVLDPPRLGLLASIGVTDVWVHPHPRITVLSTGDELVPPSQAPGPGQIRDSNRFTLAAAVEAAGGHAVDGGNIADEESALDALAEAIATSDAVVTSGGVSMGHRDLVKPWLAAKGKVVFGRVRSKPGKPVTFATVGGHPVFALPGFPVSAMVSFELLVRPAIRRMAGHPDPQRPVWAVALAHSLSHAADRIEFQRAVVTLTPAGPVARTTGPQGSGRLLSLAGANALLRLPEGAGETPQGSKVPALILGPVESS